MGSATGKIRAMPQLRCSRAAVSAPAILPAFAISAFQLLKTEKFFDQFNDRMHKSGPPIDDCNE